MKIVIINAVYGIASTGRSYKELQEYLMDNGHECVIIYGENPVNTDNAIYMGNCIDHKIHALISRISGKIGCYSTFYTFKLITYLKKSKPDIVHLGNLHSNYVNIPLLLKALGKNDISTTLTLHDCFFYTGGCMHYTQNKCYKWKTECKKCSRFRKHGAWFFDRSKFMFDYKKKGFSTIRKLGIIGVSDWITHEAKLSPILGGATLIERIYEWIDLEKFMPLDLITDKKYEFNGKKIILGVSSYWNASKGLNDFFSLAKIIDDQYLIVLVGEIDNDLQLPENIVNISRTNNIEELVKIYNRADVFLHLSKEETFGKVIAEALACGVPAIVYNSTALGELVTDKCGIVLPIDSNVNVVWKSILKLEDRNRSELRTECRVRAEKLFNKERGCLEYLEFWKKLKNVN